MRAARLASELAFRWETFGRAYFAAAGDDRTPVQILGRISAG